MPDDLKGGHYDVMMLYAVDDRAEATKCVDDIRNNIRLKDGTGIEAVLYDGPELFGLSTREL